ncbi:MULTISPECIES: carboxylesterase [Arthrobacter]|uniref:Alpha/beta fold hydrolase n=1 Tax=Arthrobacter terricola TaxID=2547396 RepID=A0A4R5K972_9MICC|nr:MULTISPECIES: alpha/beta fold hydrolase [Arthrobacter]MBT8159342.1 alpha/beta fold hydrolase [Arthrobacter sp. GN70]TDF91372.1 alpha/beta fold hydrolase [Arthrobacter terricola]
MNTLPDPSPYASTFTGDGPSVGVVMSHGFTGSPHSMRPWAEYLAAEGYAVRLPLLPGHGTSWQDMSTRRWQEWHHAVDAAYLELQSECDFVFAAGLSMGATLALRIAATRPVAGTVVVNPGLVIDDPRAAIVGALKYVMKTTPAIANDIRKPGVEEGAYPRTPVAAAHELKKLYKDTRALLPRISAPVRVFRSTVDHVISDLSITKLKESVTAPLEFIALENSYHVATLDNDAPEIFRGSAEFIKKTMAGIGADAGRSGSEFRDSRHE